MYILGAGLAGCLAAISYDKAQIIEANSEPVVNHRAILRMRGEAVSDLTGIPFKQVMVRKFVYDGHFGEFYKTALPNHIITYSRKVSSSITNRSIIDLNDDVRFIPPSNLHEQLLSRLDGRITFGCKINKIHSGAILTNGGAFERINTPIISTVPLPSMLNICDVRHNLEFQGHHKKIFVTEIEIPDCDLHMTVYIPDAKNSIYRVSLIGDRLNIESISPINDDQIDDVKNMLSIDGMFSTTSFMNHEQVLGKITSVDDSERKQLLFKLTNELNVYSLGRFACWRNILLDDVVKDIRQINRLMNKHPYERALG